jgi:hypothetical protein
MKGPDSRGTLFSAAVAAACIAAALILVLLLPAGLILSSDGTDIIQQFAASRAFAAQALASGHVPLWNPYTYSGQPFLGGFESAVLYPPNLIFLCLPLTPALNFSLLLHLILTGWGMERWARHRGLHAGAAALAGFVLPLSGAVFPHVYAGHLSILCTMAWAPWLFLGLESWVWTGHFRGLFLASAAICLQILAGHIQVVFYLGVAAGIQALVSSFAEPAARWRALPAVAGCYLTGAILGAAQLLPGLAAASEGIRHQKLDYSVAAMFGLPPENFLTLLAPGFFGSLGAYWGRAYLWEVSLFIGVASLPLIVVACCQPRLQRRAWIDLAVAGILLVLALGVHTPLFKPMYDYAPGFSHFRGWSKFDFPATLFLIMVAAAGADFALRGEQKVPRVAWGTVIAGAVVGSAALVLINEPRRLGALLACVDSSRESYLAAATFGDPLFIDKAGHDAGLSLGLGGLVLVASGLLLLFRGCWARCQWALPGLLVLEMVGFAGWQVTFSHLSDAETPSVQKFLAAHPGDYRILNLAQPNNGYLVGASDLSGSNPSVLRRYAEFITFSQGGDPDHAQQDLMFTKLSPLFALLRFRYVFEPLRGIYRTTESTVPLLPHVLLVSGAKTLENRDAIFAVLRDPQFDPARTVLLETPPNPAPQPDASGSATLILQSPDELDIDAETDKPALLLITDLYADGWRAEPLPGSAQHIYQLLPADYILRAVPLQAGHHRLRVVYAPPSFPLGVALSITGWAIWLVLLLSSQRRSRVDA